MGSTWGSSITSGCPVVNSLLIGSSMRFSFSTMALHESWTGVSATPKIVVARFGGSAIMWLFLLLSQGHGVFTPTMEGIHRWVCQPNEEFNTILQVVNAFHK
jgi:hypothetical protein